MKMKDDPTPEDLEKLFRKKHALDGKSEDWITGYLEAQRLSGWLRKNTPGWLRRSAQSIIDPGQNVSPNHKKKPSNNSNQ